MTEEKPTNPFERSVLDALEAAMAAAAKSGKRVYWNIRVCTPLGQTLDVNGYAGPERQGEGESAGSQ